MSLLERAEHSLAVLDARTALSEVDEQLSTQDGHVEARALRVRALWLDRRFAEARQLAEELLSSCPRCAAAQVANGVVALGEPDDPSLLSGGQAP